jgi:hypothetical protein
MQPVSISPAARAEHGFCRVYGDAMQDFVNLVMLTLASIASMCLGVLAAYAIFKGGFALMRWHTQQNAPIAVKPTTEVARVS